MWSIVIGADDRLRVPSGRVEFNFNIYIFFSLDHRPGHVLWTTHPYVEAQT